ncbi:MAG: hypothetical protein JKY61_04990 [Planctomycetes bacterium]|nr:hypothetical protein [Planctomycetota bacterium]
MESPRLLRVDSWKVWHHPEFDPRELMQRLQPPGSQELPIIARFESLGQVSGYWKGAPLRLKTALRYQAKNRLLRRRHPRLSEFHNLRWLDERLFAAPTPLAIGELRQRGLVRYQWLFTEKMPDRSPMSEVWADLDEDSRRRCILHLAAEVARMHSLHFVHHDLFPRNLMLSNNDALQPVAFLDAWAGGPGFCLRGPSYDIACLALDWPATWTREEQELFLESYLEGRAAQGKPIRRVSRWLRDVEGQRAAWVRKLEGSQRRRGGRPIPSADWRAPLT